LGKANPRNILIVPLKVEDVIFGVIELAAFDIYENYKIEFIEKLAESIASSLSTAKINIVTAQLLEQSQQQQEEMKAQEEELRQNMEEMLATQEESAKKEAEAEGLYRVVKETSLVVELDGNGNIIDINDNFANLLNVERTTILGDNYLNLINNSGGTLDTDFISKLQTTEIISIKTELVTQSGEKEILNQAFSSIKDTDGNIFKIIGLAHI
jgi:PAS domain-containing protein